MLVTKAYKYSAWFIVDGTLIFGLNDHGHQKLIKRTRRGIPKGALAFDSKKDAETELSIMRDGEHWPLFSHKAWVEFISWS